MKKEIDKQIQCRKLILDFYGSQLSTHGRLIIGFSVIVFTLIGIRNSIENIILVQTIIIYLAIFSALCAFLYLLFRHLMYGQLCGAVMFTSWTPELEGAPDNDVFGKFALAVYNNVLETNRKKIARFVKTAWFIGIANGKQKWGVFLCVLLSLAITLLCYLTIG